MSKILVQMLRKRTDYLLRDVYGLVFDKWQNGWVFSKQHPVKHIKDVAASLNKNETLDDAEKKLDEIIATCLIWKHSFYDWESVEKEERKKMSLWQKFWS